MSDFVDHVHAFTKATQLYDLIVKMTVRAFPNNFRFTRQDLPDIGKTAMTIADQCFARLPETDNIPQCQSGCSFCCYLGVDVTLAELWTIAAHLKEILTPEELEATKEHVRSIVNRLEGLDHGTRLPYKIPCSMLNTETGTCRIYEVRPLFCRGFNSIDRAQCEEGWGQEEWSTPQEMYQQTVYAAVSNGVQLGLAQAQMAKEYVEFNQGLLKILEDS